MREIQQNIITLMLASLVGLFISGYWIFYEIRFISTMSEFDQDIQWLFQVPYMLFIIVLFLVSFVLLVGAIREFNFEKLKAEVPWKKLIGTIIVFDASIVIFMIVHIYFGIQKNLLEQFLLIILLVVAYIYATIKQKINPIFFLVTLSLVSITILYIVFEVIL